MLRRLWNDPVWSKVIAGSILAAIGLAARLVHQWIPQPWDSIAATFSFLVSRTPVWNWLLAILGVGTLLAVVKWATTIRKPLDRWRQYTTDTFHGFIWRWKYDDAGKLWNLRCYCPHCDFELTDYFGKGNWSDQFHARTTCPDCRGQVRPLGDRPGVWKEVQRLIEKNLRALAAAQPQGS